MSNIKFQSRQTEDTGSSIAYAITYFGPRAEMEALAAQYIVGVTTGSGDVPGRLVGKRLYQESPDVWDLELRYEDGDGGAVEPPEKGYGVKLTTLHGAMLNRPLECHPDYRAKWNHYLFKAPGVTSAPDWYPTASGAIIEGDDLKKYAWGKSLADKPVDASHNPWGTLYEPTKKGVDSYDVATYTITETVRCRSRRAAGTFVSGKLNKIGSPLTTDFNISGGNWKCDDAEVSWNGKCWIARLTWTHSGNDEGWDTDLYDNAT